MIRDATFKSSSGLSAVNANDTKSQLRRDTAERTRLEAVHMCSIVDLAWSTTATMLTWVVGSEASVSMTSPGTSIGCAPSIFQSYAAPILHPR